MRIAVVEHHAEPSLGIIGEVLNEKGVQVETYWGAKGDTVPDRAIHDGLIVLGGAMNAADDKQCPYFPDLLEAIRDYTRDDKPVLGVCLGAQLVARAFEADLRLDGEFEFGFHDISPTQHASDEPVFEVLDRELPLFQWHTDHYKLPVGATRLATNENYPNQAYRIGEATYGCQFHFEADEGLVDGWIASSSDLDEKVPGYAEWLPGQFADHGVNSQAFCREVVGRWLSLVP